MKVIILFVFVITVTGTSAAGNKLPKFKNVNLDSEFQNVGNTIIRKLKPGPEPLINEINSPSLARADIQPRITGGEYAWDTMLPYQVSLTINLKNGLTGLCGGTLIGNEWVLTAAHCFAQSFKTVQIGLGSIDRKNPLHKTWAEMVLMPVRWNPNTFDGDLALLKFPWVDFNDWIAPAYLPSKNIQHLTFIDSKVIASGWGNLGDESKTTNWLKHVTMKVVENNVCSSTFGYDEGLTSIMCVSAPQGHSTCSGDSGGPLVIANSRLLVGVISFVSAKGCTQGLPIGFTRVSSYLDWIESTTGITW